MVNTKLVNTRLLVGIKVSSRQCLGAEAEKATMSQMMYSSTIGSLIFIMVCTRPDIA